MTTIENIFSQLEKLVLKEGQSEFVSAVILEIIKDDEDSKTNEVKTYKLLNKFVSKIIAIIDELSSVLLSDNTILISVKNQKLLRTCFQLVSSIGISTCLIPGLGISLSKRCSSHTILSQLKFTDEEKYEMLVQCVDFFTHCYKVPVLRNIINTLHLSDYLAALIQLSFAPLKKPGVYNNFTMTQEMYNQFLKDRPKYIGVYENLVQNCFQPTLMKELLVLQSVTDPSPPAFVKRIIAKEMSRRLLAPGGLLSLIRCFIESYNIDTGFDWKKIDMICRIISVKHGDKSLDEYLINICMQLSKILTMKNTHYLTTSVACVLCLNEKYPNNEPVKQIVESIFKAFDYELLKSTANLPGTIIMTPAEIEHKVNILHSCTCITTIDFPTSLISPNLPALFQIGTKCTKNEDLKTKLKDIVLKNLEKLNTSYLKDIMNVFLFDVLTGILIEEYDAGVCLKFGNTDNNVKSDELLYFIQLFHSSTSNKFVENVFDASIEILINLDGQRKKKDKALLELEENPSILNQTDANYANILQLLSEISTSPKITAISKENPSIVLKFIDHFISKDNSDSECTSIALVLLNIVLVNSNKDTNVINKIDKLIPVLKEIAKDKNNLNNILSKEALSLIKNEGIKTESACEKAISDVFDNLLPVRAHGVIALTKLIDKKDPETISKKHYIFCLFQEQLKDADSYLYLAAINGLASLCTHCTDDVLHVLCKEFLQISEGRNIETHDEQNKLAELRMKIGDVIVKVTRKLGEMAIVHKSILLNTMLCGCRDPDPLIRTSALSNLAEIALVLHYKVGTIIYEILLCIWSTIETDKAVECRRAAVMVISSLLKGLGKETLVQLKENLLPIYRTLKKLYSDNNEDTIVRLHAQIALEELNDIVKQFLLPELSMEKQIFVLDQPENVFK